MHVLIIPSWYPRHPGDVNGSFFREQALALNKHGCKVGVIYPELRSLRNWPLLFTSKNGISVEQDEGVATYRSHGVNWFPRTVVLASKLFVWHGHQLFERYVEENGMPDIVHVHSVLYAGSIAAEIYKTYAVPFVITEHSSAFARELISEKGLSIAKNVSSLASKKFAVSNTFAVLLNQIFSLKKTSWEVMPNMVSEKFANYKLPLWRKQKYFEFVNVALMNKNKKHAHIIHAFAETCKRYPNARLTLCGDGAERYKLEKLARDLGVAEKVKFSGLLSREQVLTAMAASDSFILSSCYETFGIAVIEALALGKPVIATRCGGPESIVRKEDGILIPVDDINALAAAMGKIIEDRHNFNPEEIRKACIARYSEATIATRLKQVYAEVVPKAVKLQQDNRLAATTNVDE